VGRGEGFGYPIVESLACGTPCLAMNYAGGAELTPPPFRYPWYAVDATNVYAIGRPLADVEVVANRAQALLQHPTELLAAYCTGSVAHLQWSALAPRWQQWVKEGMEAL
jgi:glycosyltransferase involved in cell wall biosynthesis